MTRRAGGADAGAAWAGRRSVTPVGRAKASAARTSSDATADAFASGRALCRSGAAMTTSPGRARGRDDMARPLGGHTDSGRVH